MNNKKYLNDDDFTALLYCEIFEKSEDGDDYNPRRILNALNTLTLRERRVIEYRYRNDMTYAQIADEIGVTRERVRQILVKAIRKLRHPGRTRDISVSQIEQERDRYKQTVVEQEAVIQELRLEITRLAHGLANVNIEEIHIPVNRLEWDICELGLTVRSYNCLARSGRQKVRDVYEIPSFQELFSIKNLGMKSCEEVMQRMRDLGFGDWADKMRRLNTGDYENTEVSV